MHLNKPLVSVIINCHNGEKYLKEAIQSVFNQTYKNWEIIFWDNLSSDNSKIIIKDFNKDKIKYFKSEKFLSLYDARNKAIKKARGSLIAFLDTDDWWCKDKLEKQVNIFKKNETLSLVYSNCFIYNEFTKKKKIFIKKKLPQGKITSNLLNNYSVGILTMIVDKQVFEEFSFNPKYSIIGDFDFVLKLSIKSKFACVDEPLAYHRKHEKNFSDVNLKLYINEMKDWIKFNEKNFKSEGFTLIKQKFLLKKLQIKSFIKKIIFLGV